MEDKKGEGKIFFVYSVLKGLLTESVITAVMLLAVSAAYLTAELDEGTARVLVAASSAAAVLFSAFGVGNRLKKNGLLSGAVTGILYAAVLYLTGFLAFGFPGMGKGFFPTAGLSALIGAAGGIAGVNIRGRKRS